MKKRAIWLLVPALALGSVACKKNDEGKAPEAPAAADVTPAAATPAPTAAPAAPETKVPQVSTEERAAKLGFVKHLPQDTEVVMAFHNGSKSVERIQGGKLWKLIESEMGMGGAGMQMEDGDLEPDMGDEDFALPEEEQDVAADPEGDAGAVAIADEESASDEPFGPSALFGTEFTIALGKPVGEQTGHLLTVNRRMGYFQMRSLAKALVSAGNTGDFSVLEDAFEEQYGEALFKDLLNDPESGIALFEKMKMPPLYLAFRTSAGQREAGAQQIASLVENLGMLGEMVEPVEIEQAGQKFSGHKISGAKISASMAEDRSDMEEVMEASKVDQFLAAVAQKDLVVLSGTIGDYVILFLGSTADDLKFASEPASSLVAADALAFCDAYLSKDLAAVIYGQKAAIDTMVAASGGLADMAAGLRDGLAGQEGLGDTRDLEALLGMVAERETALRKLASNETTCTAVFFEDGLKIESLGGTDMGVVDWKSPNKLASLGDSEDVVMFANFTTEASYDEKARAYLEALMETSYAVAMKVSELPGENEDMVEFKEMAKMFDGKFRTDVVSMWEAFSNDMAEGLGNESAVIVDLNGSVPPIPGIPQAVVNDGKFPRISMLAPVVDRTKLAGSWEKVNAGTTGILAKISEVSGQSIPMQKPISSEKNGFTTWFFSLPFFNDDFMPSVTVGDQWFAASTSKNQALDLLGKAAKGGETRNGLYFCMNFKAFQKFSSEMLEVIEKNQAAIPGADSMSAEDWKKAAKAIESLSDLDRLTAHSRKENGALRTSIHLKTR